jgi:hypothetical protein
MPTFIRDPQPAEFEQLLERRRTLGQDLLDEVWDGVCHVNAAPAPDHAYVIQQLAVRFDGPARAAGLIPMMSIFNIGAVDNYRVPDGGLLRERGREAFLPTAALVVEVVSPHDESWDKFDFYAAHAVDELLIIDSTEHAVHWFGLSDSGRYESLERSGLIALSAADLATQLDWPD